MLKFRAFAMGSRCFPSAPGPSQAAESSAAAQAQGIPMRQLLLDFTQAPAPTFANFVHGGNAQLAHALEAAARGAAAEGVRYVGGEKGPGHTHLLKAVAHA